MASIERGRCEWRDVSVERASEFYARQESSRLLDTQPTEYPNISLHGGSMISLDMAQRLRGKFSTYPLRLLDVIDDHHLLPLIADPLRLHVHSPVLSRSAI